MAANYIALHQLSGCKHSIEAWQAGLVDTARQEDTYQYHRPDCCQAMLLAAAAFTVQLHAFHVPLTGSTAAQAVDLACMYTAAILWHC